MSKARETFAQSIRDAENLLQHFNDLNKKPPLPELEVLKRAGLVMAMTAWETYVEDRLSEACAERLGDLSDKTVAGFVQAKLDEEIKKLHNPASQKTLQLFRDYGGVDLVENWHWHGCDAPAVRQRLDAYMKLRGDVVHRSFHVSPNKPLVHPVKKDDLKKAIAFLKNLVAATENAFE
jgi:predicted nucleic acid-binding Zn ribbon protein